MEATAAQLLPLAVNITNTAHEVHGTMRRADCHGPFFDAMDRRLSDIAERLTMGGRGLRTVANRLKDDAERVRAARLALSTKHELGPRKP
jgi:hypothetical protein